MIRVEHSHLWVDWEAFRQVTRSEWWWDCARRRRLRWVIIEYHQSGVSGAVRDCEW